MRIAQFPCARNCRGLTPVARDGRLLILIEPLHVVGAERDVEQRDQRPAGAGNARIFGDDFALPFGIEQRLPRRHFTRFDEFRVDRQFRRDVLQRAQDRVARIFVPQVAVFPLAFIDDVGRDQRRLDLVEPAGRKVRKQRRVAAADEYVEEIFARRRVRRARAARSPTVRCRCTSPECRTHPRSLPRSSCGRCRSARNRQPPSLPPSPRRSALSSRRSARLPERCEPRPQQPTRRQ